MIASDPYIIEYGVSPVHLFGVVQYAHRTWGNSSTHLPFALSNLFFNSLTINLLVASACPLLCGLVSLDYLFLIPNSQQYLRKALLLNWRPLSNMRVCGMPNLVTIFHQKNFVLVSNIGEGFHFDPFGEIISFGKKPYMIPSCFGEWPDNVQSPLCKRPWIGKEIEGSSWLMNIWGISLALVALFSKFLGGFLYVRPPISLSKSFM